MSSFGGGVDVNAPTIEIPEVSVPTFDLDEYFTDVGDCGRLVRRGDESVRRVDCSSPNASLTAVEIIDFLRTDVPANESNPKRIRAVRAAALQECPGRSVGWTDEGLQVVCWAFL